VLGLAAVRERAKYGCTRKYRAAMNDPSIQ
jgi:hypothetical protein